LLWAGISERLRVNIKVGRNGFFMRSLQAKAC
jgi:hypothetical protein